MLLVQNVSHKMHRTQSPQTLALALPQPPPLQPQAQTRVCISPAISEISVGSPSPPPPSTVFRPLSVKRLRLLRASPVADQQRPQPSIEAPPPEASRRKSTGERVKSFSIADILGKHEETPRSCSPKPKPPAATDATPAPSGASLLQTHVLNERLQPQIPPSINESSPSALPLPLQPPPVPLIGAAWDPVRAGMPYSAMHPFFSPALLHSYEQRFAWDCQRQLQEHLQAQAQLLRQMSMDPTIIPSEDGSDERSHSRSRTSSTGSGNGDDDCCSPEVEVVEAGKSTSETIQSVDNKDPTQQRQQPAGVKKQSSKTAANDTPLDALFQLSTKNFDEEQDPATLNIFATRTNPKKKRKSRTAFTNHQIFELEKRFLYQKYLSPADRDEIAAGLGLSNAQVITWFQNRRAKLKRDMEELKKDVETVKQLSGHKSFLENVNDLSILKTRPVSRHQQQPQQQQTSAGLLPTVAASSSPLTCFIALPTHVVHGSGGSSGAERQHQQQQQQQQPLQQPQQQQQPSPEQQQQQQQQQPQQRG